MKEAFSEQELHLLRAAARSLKPSTPCPDDEDMAGYMDELLPPQRAKEVARHLLSCVQCRRLYLAATMAQVEAEAHLETMPLALQKKIRARLSSRPKVSIARLVYSAAQQLLQQLGDRMRLTPLPMTVLRGEAQQSGWLLETVGDRDVEIYPVRTQSGLFDVTLKVHGVSRFSRCAWQLWSGAKLLQHLPAGEPEAESSRGRAATRTAVAEDEVTAAEAKFRHLAPGTYTCRLRVCGEEIGSFQLELKE